MRAMSTSSQPVKFIKKTWVVGPFQCNCRLLVCPSSGEAALVDPGDEAQKILSNLASVQLPNGRPVRVKYLLHTHGHLDHIAATREVKERLTSGAVSSPSNSPGFSHLGSEVKSPVIALHRG